MSRNTYSFKVDEEKAIQIINFYDYCSIANNNENIRFKAATPDFRLTVYNNLTVLIQGNNAVNEYAIWQTTENFIEHAGSDEVGVGDYFGPIVVAAAIVKKEDFAFLDELGVKDSKKLTDEKILEIAPAIKKRLKMKISVISNNKYNQVYTGKHYNLNKIKAYLHNFTLAKLIEDTNFTGPIIIDQFCERELYYRYLKDYKAPIVVENVSFYIKAESQFLAVAAASIVARYEFLQRLKEIEKELNIKIIKGAGTEVDIMAFKLVKKYGEDVLKKYSKYNFANTKKVRELLKK